MSVKICKFFFNGFFRNILQNTVDEDDITQIITNITKEEKQALKVEIEAINVQLEKKEITQEQADAIAAEKYQIARERYVLGDLSITDLSIAFAEEDQARRDFVGALREYWTAFYQLRKLTLYDFEKQQKL